MAQKQFIIDGGFVTNADSAITGNLEMTGSVVPSADITYDLGSPTAQWKDVYVGPGSLYINGQKVLEDNSGTIVVQADEDQSMTVKTAGTGILTLQSAQTVNFAATLQMAAGKKITDAGGNAVVFGDKIDADNNQIINVGNPTEAQHVATKNYVDGLIDNISTDAITEGDTEIEIADLGTGTIGFNVDGTQRLALSSSSAAYTVPVTVNGVTLANVTDVASDIATAKSEANSYTDTRETAITTAYQTYADSAESDAISTANSYTDGRETAITTAYQTYADTAEADAISTAAADATSKADTAESNANSYTDGRETAITTAYQTYADQAEADAKSYTDGRETAIITAYQTYADQAEADAISTANAYTDGRETAITTAYSSAIASGDNTVASNAAADATAKANTAESNANSYTDTQISNLVGGAPGALDTLNELAAALDDDANYASTVTSELNNIKTKAVESFTTFHVRGANFSDAEETSNATGTISRTVAELASAVHYDVYLNRVLLRGPEAGADAEYSVSGTTITFVTGIVASSDNLDIRGFSVSTIA